MEQLTPRKRVELTIHHQEPDRVPISLGGSANHLTEDLYQLLKKHFGFEDTGRRTLVGFYSTPDYNPLLDCLGTDMRFLHLRPISSFIMNEIGPKFQPFTDEWGLKHELLSGYYNLGGEPLGALETIQGIEKYPWPDPYLPERVEGLKAEAEHLYHFTEYSLVGHRPVYGNAWEMSRFLLGMEKALLMTVKNKVLFEAFFDKLSDVLDGFYDMFLEAVGPYIQIIEMAEDLGTNNGPMFNPKFYKEVMWPYHRRTIERIKKKAPHVKVMLHCDGAIRRFIPDLIDAGFDILNPIESQLVGMEPAGLKADFGKDLVFMGGVDVKKVLTKGNRQDIQKEIRTRMEEMGKGGGYILAPSHNFSNDVPLENLLVFFEEGKNLGVYPLQG
ncbi:MAG: uroporphyrinogen decarboxylase family protein [Anaerolineaceae bacterium]